MYIPPRFQVTDKNVAADVIAAHAFGLLVTANAEGPFATPLPFVYRREEGEFGTLYGHVARANPQWRQFDGNTPALATFMGPHGYISPKWYESKQAVPTWNYVTVQATGKPRLLDDPEARIMLDRLSAVFETDPDPWSMAAQETDFIRGKIKGIAGFALPVAKLEIKAKLGQDRPRADSISVAATLRRKGNAALADYMEKAAQKSE